MLAIKLTLYRTSVDTAMCARWSRPPSGKTSLVVMELKARFDEATTSRGENVERAGVHVVYGWYYSRRTRRPRSWFVARPTAFGDTCTRHRQLQLEDRARLTPIWACDHSTLDRRRRERSLQLLTGFSRQRLYRKLLVAPGICVRLIR